MTDPTAAAQRGLDERDLDPDPLAQFDIWFRDAVAAALPEPTAMTLATATPDGAPSARTVLLKQADARGFIFYTNYGSRKARELAANPRAALVFFWKALERQVCVTGTVSRVSRDESEAYFRTRPRDSRLGAWASRQSTVIPNRETLDARCREMDERYRDADPPLPPFWGGFRLVPDAIEFWQGRSGRLHDRLRYRRGADGAWVIERLAP